MLRLRTQATRVLVLVPLGQILGPSEPALLLSSVEGEEWLRLPRGRCEDEGRQRSTEQCLAQRTCSACIIVAPKGRSPGVLFRWLLQQVTTNLVA